MSVLAAVLAGHLVGDWIVQTDWQAATKVRPARFERSVDEELEQAMTATVRDAPRRSVWLPDPLSRAAVVWDQRRAEYWTSWRANQAHMLGYHLAIVACVVCAYPAHICAWRLAVLVAVSWLTHSFIDRRWPVRWLMEHTGSGPFSKTTWGPVVVDQALHLSILCLLVGGLRL